MSSATIDAISSSRLFENPLYLDSTGSAHFDLDDDQKVAPQTGTTAKVELNEKDMILTRLVGAPQVPPIPCTPIPYMLHMYLSWPTFLRASASQRLYGLREPSAL